MLLLVLCSWPTSSRRRHTQRGGGQGARHRLSVARLCSRQVESYERLPMQLAGKPPAEARRAAADLMRGYQRGVFNPFASVPDERDVDEVRLRNCGAVKNAEEPSVRPLPCLQLHSSVPDCTPRVPDCTCRSRARHDGKHPAERRVRHSPPAAIPAMPLLHRPSSTWPSSS